MQFSASDWIRLRQDCPIDVYNLTELGIKIHHNVEDWFNYREIKVNYKNTMKAYQDLQVFITNLITLLRDIIEGENVKDEDSKNFVELTDNLTRCLRRTDQIKEEFDKSDFDLNDNKTNIRPLDNLRVQLCVVLGVLFQSIWEAKKFYIEKYKIIIKKELLILLTKPGEKVDEKEIEKQLHPEKGKLEFIKLLFKRLSLKIILIGGELRDYKQIKQISLTKPEKSRRKQPLPKPEELAPDDPLRKEIEKLSRSDKAKKSKDRKKKSESKNNNNNT